mmetsp:Transcript_34855/g.30686  ORF Transcript_34855/g.30686 Transcript_34855/m.30686 type:complete len:497 (-) Transcript_34855:155-1645(-)
MFNKNNEHSKSTSSKSKSKSRLKVQPVLVSDVSTTDASMLYNNDSNNSSSSSESKSRHNNSNNNKKDGNILKKFGKKLFGKKNSRKSINGDIASLEQISNKQISERMAEEELEQKSTLDILLLGAGGSGKTTVFKQMQKLFHGFIDEKEMEFALDDIRENIMVDMIDLCKYNMDRGYTTKIESIELREICSRIASLNSIDQPNSLLTKSLSKEIYLLWSSPSIKETWELRKKSHIMDNTPYFLDNVQHFANPNCIVTFDDFVRIRDQTTGIIQTEFFVENGRNKWLFKITDVGGQRAERRKWLHVFAGVDVVIYVMSLSAYDQVLYEDHNTRCWDETLNLFEKTAANKSFKETDFIIFMNKSDIFDEKIKVIPFDTYKPDYPKDQINDGESVKNWLQQEFQTRFFNPSNRARQYNSNRYGRNNGHNGHIVYKNNNNEEEKEDIGNGHAQNGGHDNKTKRGIHFHITCATDTNQIETVVRCVQIELIRKLMSRAALL